MATVQWTSVTPELRHMTAIVSGIVFGASFDMAPIDLEGYEKPYVTLLGTAFAGAGNHTLTPQTSNDATNWFDIGSATGVITTAAPSDSIIIPVDDMHIGRWFRLDSAYSVTLTAGTIGIILHAPAISGEVTS